MSTSKPFSPACERNREPILKELKRAFADRRSVLEIGSGTGQHAVYFAEALPHLRWQTSDVRANIAGITAWLDEAQLPNTPSPLLLDANEEWPPLKFDAVFSANTLHIMSWLEVTRLFAHLQQVLEENTVLAIYGPFNYAGKFTSESNAAFDQSLKERNSLMGIRDIEAVHALAKQIGLKSSEDVAMPANNRLLIWQRM